MRRQFKCACGFECACGGECGKRLPSPKQSHATDFIATRILKDEGAEVSWYHKECSATNVFLCDPVILHRAFPSVIFPKRVHDVPDNFRPTKSCGFDMEVEGDDNPKHSDLGDGFARIVWLSMLQGSNGRWTQV